MKNNIKQRINLLLAKLVDGVSLSTKETQELFQAVYTHDTNGFLFAIMTAAIHAKGETPEELVGIIRATQQLMPKLKMIGITDTSSSGGGVFKTINVGTLSAFVVAAAGHQVLKASFRGITSPIGSADILNHFGIDVFKLSFKQVTKLLKTIGIAPYYAAALSQKLANRALLAKKLFAEEGVKIKTPYHLSTNLCAPVEMKKRIYGCYAKKDLMKLGNVFRLLGYSHTLSFTATVGMAEISNVGTTHFVEQKENTLRSFTLKPGDMGVKPRKKEEIAFRTAKQSFRDFENILKGTGPEAKIDLVALNAGASLYLMESLPDIKAGVAKAKKILLSGAAYQKFEQLRKILN